MTRSNTVNTSFYMAGQYIANHTHPFHLAERNAATPKSIACVKTRHGSNGVVGGDEYPEDWKPHGKTLSVVRANPTMKRSSVNQYLFTIMKQSLLELFRGKTTKVVHS